MDDKIVIDCIGPSVLTVMMSGAVHSVSVSTEIIRIGGPAGVTAHNLDSLPLTYDAAALGGRLNICDGAGQMVYCWRSLVTLQSRPSVSAQEGPDCSPSSSLGPAARTEISTPDSSLASVLFSRPGKRRSTSVRIGDTSPTSTESASATLSPSGNSSHDMTISQDNPSDETLEEPAREPEGSVNEELVVSFGRDRRELLRKREFGKLESESTCAHCGNYPHEPIVTGCLHLYCNACLENLKSEAARDHSENAHCAACDDTITESQSYQHLKEALDYLQGRGWDFGQEAGQRYTDPVAKNPQQQSSTITEPQRNFLVYAVNKLMKLSYSEFFRQPVPADQASYPTYFGVRRPIDLKTMRVKLRASAYPSIELLKADFDQMEQDSRVWNGADHQHTKDAQNLKVAFERYMTEYPEPDEKFVPRKKAKTVVSNNLPAQIPARAGPSSPPRAAKTAMQGQKYPRDHW